MEPSSQRMRDNIGLFTSIQWEPFVDIPESVMIRIPELREYNNRLRLRDEANREKIENELSKLQKAVV